MKGWPKLDADLILYFEIILMTLFLTMNGADYAIQLNYPENKLTEYLFDLRKYRPKDHQAYINFMKYNSNKLEFKKFCLENTDSCISLLKNLNWMGI